MTALLDELITGRLARIDRPHLSARERRNLAIAQVHIEELWGKGRAELAYLLYAPDVIDYQPAPNQRPGIDGIVDVLLWLREAVPDLHMNVLDYVVEGDIVADRWEMRGTHTGRPLFGLDASGAAFHIAGMDVIRVRDDGLIGEVWHVEEFAHLRDQVIAHRNALAARK